MRTGAHRGRRGAGGGGWCRAVIAAAEGARGPENDRDREDRCAAQSHHELRLAPGQRRSRAWGRRDWGTRSVDRVLGLGPGPPQAIGNREPREGRARRAARPWAPLLAWQARKLGLRSQQTKLLRQLGGQLEVGGVVLQVAHGVGPADRVGLAQQVVGQADVAIGIGAGKLRERGARPGLHLCLANPQQRGEVGVALAALQQELQHRLLVARESHRRKAYGVRVLDDSADESGGVRSRSDAMTSTVAAALSL